jgi:bacterioferritin-associated ferredoxin
MLFAKERRATPPVSCASVFSQLQIILDKRVLLLQIILMIICVCRRINETGVREAVEAGARSPEAVQAHHGCEFNCGKCRCAMGEVIADTLDSRGTELQLIAAE